MLDFNYIKVYGFGSLVGPIKFRFGDNGLTLIKGLNGAGKTTLFSALSWVCYGTTLKEKSKAVTWEHIQPEDYKGVKVEIDFNNDNHHVQIIRCENYKGKVEGSKGGKRLILKVDGQAQHQYGDKISTQKAINKLIGMSFNLFVNSIIFGQKMKRIIDETGPKQKGIFDEAFEVTYVNSAKNSVEVDYKKLRDDHSSLDASLTTIKNKIDSTKEVYSNSKESEERFEILKFESINKTVLSVTDKNIEKKSTRKELKKLNKQVVIEKKFVDEWDYHGWEKADDKYHLSKSAIILKNMAIGSIEDDIKRLGRDILKQPSKCGECGAPLDKKKRKKLLADLKQKRNKAKVTLNTLEVEKSGLEDDRDFNKATLDKWNEGKKEYDKAESDIRFLFSQISNAERKFINIKQELVVCKENVSIAKLKTLEIKSVDYKEQLVQLRLERKPLRKALKKNKSDLEILEWLVKDPLSNSGLKTYIFNSMLGAVNDELYRYATILGFEVEFAINMESKRKEFYSLVAKDGHIIPFNDLSGGQKQLVNIAIAFAIHAVVNKNNKVNILVMDEVFESLDSVNIDIVNELIQMKAETKAIYLITHQKDFTPRNCTMMHFDLTKTGVTRIV